MEHTLALGYLRQGRFAEVEPFCENALHEPIPAVEQARVLATVVMARARLGQPYHEMLTEAVRLAPGAELVKEAVGRVATVAY